MRQLLTACVFLEPPRADTQGSVISSAPLAQAARKEEKEKDIHFHNSYGV